MIFPLLKTFHIIGFVAWFAGLFYLVRLFIYHVEAEQKEEPQRSILNKQFILMERRVYKIIANPGMIITLVAGFSMLYLQPAWFKQPWMHAKLTLLFLLVGYHHFCLGIMKKLEKGTNKFGSQKLRMINEIATLFLVGKETFLATIFTRFWSIFF